MNAKRLGSICGFAALSLAIPAIWLLHTNDLGLSGFDLLMGGRPNVETIRTNTKAVADSFLGRRKADLLGENKIDYDLALDYSKSSEIRSLGYRSSFYYYCWNIYLPYSLRTNGADVGTIIVQLSDAVEDNRHDPKRFHVIRAALMSGQSEVIKEIEQP